MLAPALLLAFLSVSRGTVAAAFWFIYQVNKSAKIDFF